MPTANIPFTYACKTAQDVVHLYILMFSSSTRPGFPSQGTQIGNTLSFQITSTGTGSTPHFQKYQFNKGTITDIHLLFNFNGNIRTKKLEISDFDLDNPPVETNSQAFEAPYGITKKIDEDNFFGELVIFAQSPGKNFVCQHVGPLGTDKNTFSKITDNGPVQLTMFTEIREFNVPAFNQPPDGVYEISYGDPPKKKARTKNRNVTVVPFPKKRIQKP